MENTQPTPILPTPSPIPSPVLTPQPAPATPEPVRPHKSVFLSWFAVILVIAVLGFGYYAIGSHQGWWPFPQPLPLDELTGEPATSFTPENQEPLTTPGILEPFSEISGNQFVMTYAGRAVLSGTYFLSNDGVLGNLVLFIPDTDSTSLLPDGAPSNAGRFAFANQELAKDLLNIGDRDTCSYEGTATIVIDGYTIDRTPTETYDGAPLSEVLRASEPNVSCYPAPVPEQ